jgi:predicted MFS family arabinose efflux permease
MIVSAFSVASALGVPFGVFLASMFSWHAPFILLAILGIPVSYFIWKYVPSITAHIHLETTRPNPIAILRGITSDPNQRKAITLMLVLMFGHFSIIPMLNPYMVSNVGFEEFQLTYIYAIGGVLTVFSSQLIGKWADCFGKRKVFTVFVLLCTVPIFLMTNMPKVPIWMALMATASFFVFSGGRFIPAQAMVTETVKPETRGSFMSISSSLQQLCAGIAAYTAGSIVVKQPDGTLLNYNWVGYISIAATLFCLVLVQRIRDTKGHKF